MCYSSTMPSRKQSHYRYQNKNLHLASHFGHVIFNWYKILSPNLGHKTKPPHTFFFFGVWELGCFTAADQNWYHHWEQGTWTGVPLSAGSFCKPSASTVCERNFVTNTGLGLLHSVKHRTCSVLSWKLLLETGHCSLYQVTLSTGKPCCFGGCNLKADISVFYIYLILIWRYKNSYRSLSNSLEKKITLC